MERDCIKPEFKCDGWDKDCGSGNLDNSDEDNCMSNSCHTNNFMAQYRPFLKALNLQLLIAFTRSCLFSQLITNAAKELESIRTILMAPHQDTKAKA